MSWQDRPYSQKDDRGGLSGYSGTPRGGGVNLAMPKPGKVVKWLLILNIAIFVLQNLAGDFRRDGGGVDISGMFGATGQDWMQPWRYITFQFLHGGGWHLIMNMMGLYFLGTPLEGRMGGRRFLIFYLSCGVAAGIAYVAITLLLRGGHWIPIVGASGGVYGIILAAAVFFPHFRLIFLFFPVPIRLAAVIIFSLMTLTILQGLSAGVERTGEFWSQVAHFGGAAMAGVWILTQRRKMIAGGGGGGGGGVRKPTLGEKIQKGRWERKMRERRKLQVEIDRILEKIHTNGIASLNGREKRMLKQATDEQRAEDNKTNMM